MFAFATTFILLSASRGAPPAPQPRSDSLPDAPSSQSQQASPPPRPATVHPGPQWLKVEALQPGDSIAVQEPGRRFSIPCRFDDATDDTLTCTVYPLHTAPRRTVYPVHNIDAV